MTPPSPSHAEARSRVVHDRLLTPSEAILDFDWFIGWVVGLLSQYGFTVQPAEVAVRAFVWGLQSACSHAQWESLAPVVRSKCAPAICKHMAVKFHMDAPGPIGG